MFTGIVEEIGRVKDIEKGSNSARIFIDAKKVLENTKIGDSIAVNGLCLTVTDIYGGGFAADIMPESLRRSNLGSIEKGGAVNLERALAADGRFGGHIVSGHIDAKGEIIGFMREENAVWVKIKAESDVLRYIVEKGSVAIDGISLTVAEVSKESFSVSIIPLTAKETTLLSRNIGYFVNLECDIVGKYIERFLYFEKKSSNITLDFLAENGFL